MRTRLTNEQVEDLTELWHVKDEYASLRGLGDMSLDEFLGWPQWQYALWVSTGEIPEVQVSPEVQTRLQAYDRWHAQQVELGQAVNPLAAPRRIAIAGDWHANKRWALAMIEHAQDSGVDTILQVGDFGFWTNNDDYFSELEARLRRHDTVLLWVDGNHEDHARLTSSPPGERYGLRWIRPHIWHIPRGFRWEWDGITFLGLGGAASVDQHYRTEWVDWWRAELIGTADIMRAVDGGPVDVMICHDAPAGAQIPDLTKTADFWPEDVIRKSEGNRAMLRSVVDEVRPRVLYHGHYHVRYTDDLALQATPVHEAAMVRIIGLDRDEPTSHPEDNMLIMDLEEVTKTP